MKKVMFILLGIILGIVGTSYAAYKLKAEQVSFDNNKLLEGNNVQEAIDEISYLIKDQIGTTDISNIGDGTITGAIKELNPTIISKVNEDFILPYGTTIKYGTYTSVSKIDIPKGTWLIIAKRSLAIKSGEAMPIYHCLSTKKDSNGPHFGADVVITSHRNQYVIGAITVTEPTTVYLTVYIDSGSASGVLYYGSMTAVKLG